MTDDINELKRKLKKREGVPGYEASVVEIKQRIADIEGQAALEVQDTVSLPPEQKLAEAVEDVTLAQLAEIGADDTNSAETSPEIASEAGRLMKHPDPKVRSVAASAVRQARKDD